MLTFLIFQYTNILFKPHIRCSSFETSDIFWAPKLGRGLKHLLIDYKSLKLTDPSIELCIIDICHLKELDIGLDI